MNPQVKDAPSQILGLWDLKRSALTLGGGLVLVEELLIQKRTCHLSRARICIVGPAENLRGVDISKDGFHVDSCLVLDAENCRDSALLSALLHLEGIDGWYFSSGTQGFKQLSEQPGCLVWPEFQNQRFVNYHYEDILDVQSLFQEYGRVVALSLSRECVDRARDFIKTYAPTGLTVAVHLKNNPLQKRCSNAYQPAWLEFFRACQGKFDATFILVGNEEVDERIVLLTNVVVAQKKGSQLSLDLALIQSADAFMGMASGPCNMVLFGDQPFVIFKNLEHHAAEMEKELGLSDHFNFSKPLQKILRVDENKEILMNEFAKIYHGLTKQSC